MTVKIKNVSVDIESWGTDPGADIRSIGACLFEPSNFLNPVIEDKVFYVACDNPLIGSYCPDHYTSTDLDFVGGAHRKYNLNRDPRTVLFWHEQSEELQDAFKDAVDLKESLTMFANFLYSLSEDIRDDVIYDIDIWSHGAAFDPPIIKVAFDACGLKYPLFYRSPRDTRTVYDNAGITNHSAHQRLYQMGPVHHAKWDGMSQAAAITAAVSIINCQKEGRKSSSPGDFRAIRKVPQ